MMSGPPRAMMGVMDDLWGLQRSVTDAKVAGVCAALADRWRIDPLVVRMATVIAMLSAGVGVVLYTAAAVMLPREGEEHSPLERSFPDARQWSKRNLAVAMLIAAEFPEHFVVAEGRVHKQEA